MINEVIIVAYLAIGVILGIFTSGSFKSKKINPFLIKFGMVFLWLPLMLGVWIMSMFDDDYSTTKD